MNMDTYWLAVNVYFEATGEPYEGKKAVAHVTLNRARQKNESIETVVFKPDQFSWTIKYGKNTRAKFAKNLDGFAVCWKAALEAIEENKNGYYLRDANHFWNPEKVGTPSWSRNMRFIKRIGDHVFYYDHTY